MALVVLSYSRRDAELARSLHSWLSARCLDVWVDWERVAECDYWRREVLSAIEVASLVVLLVTPASLASPHCRWEVRHARRTGTDVHLLMPAPTGPALRRGEVPAFHLVMLFDGRRRGAAT